MPPMSLALVSFESKHHSSSELLDPTLIDLFFVIGDRDRGVKG